MKKLILFLFLSTSLFCFGQGKSALKDIQSIKFYGVDYSQAKVFGADESPIQFKDAFRRINELFITEAKKLDSKTMSYILGIMKELNSKK